MCNCKQQKPAPPPVQPKTIVVNSIVVMGEPIKPQYTKEELDRCDSYFKSTKPTSEQKMFVVDFHNQYFPEKMNYEVSGESLLRLKRRVEHLKTQYSNYERELESWKAQENSK